ncbi:MAG: tetratricopeptide repeat protein [Treponema sp.]|jgi:tetratricopeptide (TPR) repeat protein|nr:tetratricopeptide repeat protein [Treponema sp.]
MEKGCFSIRDKVILIWKMFFLMMFLIPAAIQAQMPRSAASYYEQGRRNMINEDWYAASEDFLECLRLSPAHAEATDALANCYYELGEFDEALVWVRKARTLSRGNMTLANLEALTLIALGQLDAASSLIADILIREPYNREVLFTSAELDIASGYSSGAVNRYQEGIRRFPDDKRLLISLALVLGSMGDQGKARIYIEQALVQHPDDFRVYYYAAYLNAQAGQVREAISYAERSLVLNPGYQNTRFLLACLRYRAGQYEEAVRLADEIIDKKRDTVSAWYLKGLSYIMLKRRSEALVILSTAISIDSEDEFVRVALEELIVSETNLEDKSRERWAAWHFDRGKNFAGRNLIDQAVFEYRRGLRINPYSPKRREYADLLRIQGYPARYLEELRFIQNLPEEIVNTAMKGEEADAFRNSVEDAVETYNALLGNALFRRWSVDPIEIAASHWKIAVFALSSQSSFYHTDAAALSSSYIKDILIHERNIQVMPFETRQPSFSQAFRTAREGGADYFLIVSVTESERDIAIKGELFVGRTGTPAKTFNTFRTGSDRLRNSARGIVEALAKALPFRAQLIRRVQPQGLIDKGRVDGVGAGTAYEIVKKGRFSIQAEGIGLSYAPGDVVGGLTIENADEEVSSGLLSRNGFFDLISVGDEVFLKVEKKEAEAAGSPIDPELRALLRTVR